jgi:hypothetical protein
MVLLHLREYRVEIGTTVMCWRAKTGETILHSCLVVQHDVTNLVKLKTTRQIGVDLKELVNVLRLKGSCKSTTNKQKEK